MRVIKKMNIINNKIEELTETCQKEGCISHCIEFDCKIFMAIFMLELERSVAGTNKESFFDNSINGKTK